MMLVLAAAVLAQSPPLDLVQRVAAAHATVLQMDRVFADSVWPDFRPDTIPVLYVAPSIGTLLAGWRGPLPPGFTPLGDVTGTAWQPVAARGAASTGTQLAGRPTAQVVVRPQAGVAELVGLTAHEAFHVFEGASARDGASVPARTPCSSRVIRCSTRQMKRIWPSKVVCSARRSPSVTRRAAAPWPASSWRCARAGSAASTPTTRASSSWAS